MADQEKSTTEMLKELMEKMSSLEKQVQEGASCKGGQKRPRDSEGEDSAMPGVTRWRRRPGEREERPGLGR